ncbi:MAG: hypothetical protein ACFB5Z_13515 [Elainellaceae cyanobacterium]
MSYTPEPGSPNYEPMLAALAQLFEAYAVDVRPGEDDSLYRVSFDYTTQLYYGQLTQM